MMNISQFKESRASELEVTAKLLENIFSSGINTTPIYLAIEVLKTQTPRLSNGSTNDNFWGYNIEDLKIPVDTTNHLKPKIINNKRVELILNMRLIADYTKWESLHDPLVELNFNVVVRGVSNKGNHFFCFHIDKHDSKKETNEPHPTYHLQFFNNPYDDDCFDYGATFHLDTPRIIHHPVDLILGVGFLTSNFFPYAFDEMMNDGYFLGLYKRYQEHIVRPYFHTLSSHWAYDRSKIIWDKSQLCPSFI